jgi:hypothetical protein
VQDDTEGNTGHTCEPPGSLWPRLEEGPARHTDSQCSLMAGVVHWRSLAGRFGQDGCHQLRGRAHWNWPAFEGVSRGR